MPHALFADIVTAVHLAVVLFMLGGMLVVPLGGVLGWSWVRNLPFRLTHLGIMGYIVFNAIRGELCFLTYWEMDLRQAAGQEAREQWSFVGRLLHDILFVEVDQDVLHGIYIGLGALVLGGLLFVPPRSPRNRLPSDSMNTVTRFLGDPVRILIDVGLFLIVAHVIYPGAEGSAWAGMDVLGNLNGFVGQFMTSINGLLTLLVFLSLAKR